MRPTRPAFAALVLLAGLISACQPAEPENPAATLAASTPTPTPSSTTESPLPSPSPTVADYAIPDPIDAPYVQRVLQALYSLESEAVRQMAAADEVTDDAAALLRAANRPVRIEPLLERYRGLAAEGFPGVLDQPGDQIVTVATVISANEACLFASGYRDFRSVAETPEFGDDAVFYFQLLPKDPAQDETGLNPTPWMLAGGEVRSDGVIPEDPCTA